VKGERGGFEYPLTLLEFLPELWKGQPVTQKWGQWGVQGLRLGIMVFLTRNLFIILGYHLRGIRVIRRGQTGKKIPLGDSSFCSELSCPQL
jgi:hypothetical protein